VNQNLILSGCSYDNIGPYLKFCDIDSGKYHKQYLNKEYLTVRKLDRRYCIGLYDLSVLSYKPCPYKNKLELGSKPNNCSDCYSKIGFNPAFYNTKKISPEQLEYNKKNHVVYLAYFSPLHIKVGIASEKRAELRLLEQGVRSAFILKTFPNAYLARELEHKICHGEYEVLERLLSEQKTNIFCNTKYDSGVALKNLNETLKSIDIYPESSFLEFDSKYFNGNIYDFESLENIKNPKYLSGETVGMIGNAILLKQNGTFFLISIKKFISYEIEIEKSENFIKYEIAAKQTSLW
jgi:hypothetical protein